MKHIDSKPSASSPATENPSRYPLASCRVLVNPSRHPGRAKRLVNLLHRVPVQSVVVSESESHFEQAVQDFLDGDTPYLLIYGGDGTINRALNRWGSLTAAGPGSLDSGPSEHGAGSPPQGHTHSGEQSTKSIGFLRGGSGNGYHDSYGVPRNLRRQLRTYGESMRTNRTMDVDIMKITEGHRVCYGQLFGLGFDAEVLKLRDSRTAPGRGRTVVPGLLNYVRSTIAALVKLEIPPAEAVKRYVLELTDGVEIRERKRNKGEPPFRSLRLETNAPMIEICKRSFYGNRFRICPDALPGNGFLEVKIFDFEKKPPVLINILPLWMGWHRWINRKKRTDGGSRILHYRARHVSISSSEPFEFHVDGELKTTLQTGSSGGRVEITVLPGALSFLAGACAVEQ